MFNGILGFISGVAVALIVSITFVSGHVAKATEATSRLSGLLEDLRADVSTVMDRAKAEVKSITARKKKGA